MVDLAVIFSIMVGVNDLEGFFPTRTILWFERYGIGTATAKGQQSSSRHDRFEELSAKAISLGVTHTVQI